MGLMLKPTEPPGQGSTVGFDPIEMFSFCTWLSGKKVWWHRTPTPRPRTSKRVSLVSEGASLGQELQEMAQETNAGHREKDELLIRCSLKSLTGALRLNSSANHLELAQTPQGKGHGPRQDCSYFRCQLRVQRGPQATGNSD